MAAEHTDSVVNALTAQGVIGRDKTSANTFVVDYVSAEQGMQLWRGNAIGARIVENPVTAALRQGYELCIGDQDVPDQYTPEKPVAPLQAPPMPKTARPTTDIAQHPGASSRTYRARLDSARRRRMDADDGKALSEKITKKFDDLQLNKMIKEAWCYARASNGGALLIGANDFSKDLMQPLDLSKVRSFDYLTPLESRELVPMYWYNNPRAPKFGMPAIYQLVPYNIGAPAPGDGSINSYSLIHESRLIVFDGTRVTRRNIYSQSGWGDNVFTRVGRALMAWDSATQGAAQLMSDFAQAVYKVKGLADLIGKNKNALRDKMIQTDLMRSIARAMILDADGEDFERKVTPMSGYSETMDRLATNVAACAGQPIELLFCQAPAGLNATGDSSIRWFYDTVAGEQQDHVLPAVMRCTQIALACEGEDPSTINHSIRFKPLWQPTDQETSASRLAQAQTDQIYIVNDVLSSEEVTNSRFGGDQYSFETRVDFEARAQQNAVVAPVVDAKPKADPVPPALLNANDERTTAQAESGPGAGTEQPPHAE